MRKSGNETNYRNNLLNLIRLNYEFIKNKIAFTPINL
jgi:hypothetical protein